MKYLILLLAMLLTACSSVDSMIPFYNEQAVCLLRQNFVKQPAEQMIVLNMPHGQKWEKIGDPVMLIPQTKNAEKPLENVLTKSIAYATNPHISAHGFFLNEIELAKKECEHVDAKILSEGKEALIYQLNIAQCAHLPDQKKIGKIFNGVDAVYAVRYKAEACIHEDNIRKMAHAIQTARLISAKHLVL